MSIKTIKALEELLPTSEEIIESGEMDEELDGDREEDDNEAVKVDFKETESDNVN